MFNKILSIILISVCIFTANCEAADKTDLIIFAAASMTETMTKIKRLYEREHDNINILYNFDSSGTLKTQIQEGADCDLFISAGQKQMDQLKDFILDGTRINLLENKIALVVPDGNPRNIKTFDYLAQALMDKNKEILFAMGNNDVPVGQYTQKIFEFYGLKERDLALSGKITYGTNVKEVTAQVKEGSVDCGVVYCTDAHSAELEVVDTATLEMCGQVIYPACVIKSSRNINAAKDFLIYLTQEEASKIFVDVGFIPAI